MLFCQLNRQIWATLGWVIALTVGLFLVYCGYTELQEGGQPWSQPVRTAYESLSRPAFAACVSWVIYACHTGRGGKSVRSHFQLTKNLTRHTRDQPIPHDKS